MNIIQTRSFKYTESEQSVHKYTVKDIEAAVFAQIEPFYRYLIILPDDKGQLYTLERLNEVVEDIVKYVEYRM